MWRLLATLTALAVLAGAAEGAAGQAGPGASGQRPNVIVFMTDDQTARDAAHMPTVQRLARRGATFTQALVSFPICCPARATFLTGQYAHNHGVKGNFFTTGGGFDNFRGQRDTLPVWLRRAGYGTAFVGKYLNEYGGRDPELVPPGWSDWHGLVDFSTYNLFNWAVNDNGRVRYFGDAGYARKLIEFARGTSSGGYESLAEGVAGALSIFQPLEDYGSADDADYQIDVTGRIADAALRRGLASDRPFFLYYAPVAAHKESDFERVGGARPGGPKPDPRPPARYARAFDDVELPRDPSFSEPDVSDKPETVRDREPLDEETIEELTENHRGRLGSLRAADDALARLLATLRRAGALDRTLVIVTSDQGYLQGQHRIDDNKYLPYEPSMRIPLFMAGPGVPRGITVREPVYNHDLTATIADAAGARPGRAQDGVSLLPRLRGEPLPPRALLLEALAPQLQFKIGVPLFDLQVPFHGIRTERFKYVRYSFGESELYDLRRDPWELENRAEDPRYAALVRRLDRAAQALRSCSGRSCVRPLSALVRDGGAGRTPLEPTLHATPARLPAVLVLCALALLAAAGALRLIGARRGAA